MSKVDAKVCPSEEDLIAWFDSELQDKALEKHLGECQSCNEKVRTYHKIDNLIQEDLTVDGEVVLRIKRQTMNQIRKPAILSPKLWISIIACLIVIVIILVVKSKMEAAPSGDNSKKEDTSLGKVDDDKYKSLDSAVLQYLLPSEQDYPQLSHTWSVVSLSKTIDVLLDLMPQEQQYLDMQRSKRESFQLIVDLNNKDLEQMKKAFTEECFNLETKIEPPQTADMIRYKIKFIAD